MIFQSFYFQFLNSEIFFINFYNFELCSLILSSMYPPHFELSSSLLMKKYSTLN